MVMALGTSILIVLLIGSWLSGSLALLADAGHVFADVLGVGLAAAAVTVANRPTRSHRTFGLFRLEIFATVITGFVLMALSGWILYSAAQRWSEPADIQPGLMMLFASYGVVANLAGLWLLRGQGKSLAVKGASGGLSDMLGSFAVIIAGLVVLLTGWSRADSVASALIALMIIPRTLLLLRDAFGVLMENAPPGMDVDALRADLEAIPGVVRVHDLHVWTITSGTPSLSAHVLTDLPRTADAAQMNQVLVAPCACARASHNVVHTTFQLETAEFDEVGQPHP
jgi:cobalt-zinc-cadmium efflux system protein